MLELMFPKNDFSVCLIFLFEDLCMKIKSTRKFNNNKSGFKALLKWIETKKDDAFR